MPGHHGRRQELGLGVDHSCGLHLHLGWLGRNVEELKQAIRLARLFEPAVATIVSPSRIRDFDGGRYSKDSANRYCAPISQVFPRKALEKATSVAGMLAQVAEQDSRYVSFNIQPLNSIHTVEIRLHNGTTEARKVLPWLSLWQQILWAAAHVSEVPSVEDTEVIDPNGDLVALVQRYLPGATLPRFLDRLHERREEIAKRWAAVPELAGWLPAASRWQAPRAVEV